ncbi:snoRNA-binding protein [Malassezia cuniculi]|uniref:H/ACA ribonucleoprotein complex subunit 2 n=1 Tax=Malassezia cuniculi TaxID=948313 RepID=A0AAF0EUF3_9BASI|nr:snoRNA-binding protein [Malassezia cuniculi]
MAPEDKKSLDAASPAKEKKDKKEKKEKKDKKKDKKDKSDADASFTVDTTGDVTMDDINDAADPDLLSPIAQPLADAPLIKKLFKTVKKASKNRGHVKRGVKEVVKSLRKGEKGLVIFAGDISPIDIMSHIPVLCEDTQNPYIYVPSKDALGGASATKRPTSCIMIVPGGGKKAIEKGENKVKEDYQDEYSFVHKEASRLVEQLLLG